MKAFKHIFGVRKTLLIAATAGALLSMSAQAAAVDSHAKGISKDGLKVVQLQAEQQANNISVDAVISRSRITNLLRPQVLHISVTSASDHSELASKDVVVSAADIAHGNVRDLHVSMKLTVPANAAYVEVSATWQ